VQAIKKAKMSRSPSCFSSKQLYSNFSGDQPSVKQEDAMNLDNATSGHAFGQRVRQRRRSLNLTQEELARRVGYAAITLRKIEAGDARPSPQIAEHLAMAPGDPS
jgi:ribosome-binding protein aMBF1 (putative translation factor)